MSYQLEKRKAPKLYPTQWYSIPIACVRVHYFWKPPILALCVPKHLQSDWKCFAHSTMKVVIFPKHITYCLDKKLTTVKQASFRVWWPFSSSGWAGHGIIAWRHSCLILSCFSMKSWPDLNWHSHVLKPEPCSTRGKNTFTDDELTVKVLSSTHSYTAICETEKNQHK